jgi:hypothetical protein
MKLPEQIERALSQRFDTFHRRPPIEPGYAVRAARLPACLLAGLFACGHTSQPAATATGDREAVPWRYEVRFDGSNLQVEARFAPSATGNLQVDDEANPFVHDLVTSVEDGWRVARYRFALREAADRLASVDVAIGSGDVLVAPPSTWLKRPDTPSAGDFRLHVVTDPPGRFVAGMHPSRDGAPDTYEAAAADLDGTSFAAFGAFHLRTISRGAARVLVAIAPRDLGLSDDETTAWASSAVDAIAGYLRRDFPVPRTLIVVMRGKGAQTRGETLGDGGPAVLVRAGSEVTPKTTRDDWVMTHELIHVTMPSLPRDAAWLSEGIASYVEPIARVRLGTLSRDKMWGDLVEGLPNGLPEAGDQGLERTHTWGRTYWGGSLFCLVADVRIREQTGGARSFDDVIRAVVATGADVETRWDVARFLDVGDAATGTRVLHDVYRELALAPGNVDLAAFWRRLGVVRVAAGGSVTYDEAAPLAAVRHGIEHG